MRCVAALGAAVLSLSAAQADLYRVTIQVVNVGPEGVVLDRIWLLAHTGGFEIGDAASDAPAPVPGQGVARFEQFRDIRPGETRSTEMILDSSDHSQRYFSFAQWMISGQGYLVTNTDPTAHPLFDASGQFVAQNFTTFADEDLWTAGANDEISMDMNVVAQPNGRAVGLEEGATARGTGFTGLARHDGPSGGVWSAPAGTDAGFDLSWQYPLATFQFTAVPVPTPGAAVLILVAMITRGAWKCGRQRGS